MQFLPLSFVIACSSAEKGVATANNFEKTPASINRLASKSPKIDGDGPIDASPARLRLLKQGEPIWQKLIDIDGDGAMEDASIFDFRPNIPADNEGPPACTDKEECKVSLVVKGQLFEIPVMHHKDDKPYQEVTAKIVNIAPSKEGNDIVIQSYALAPADPGKITTVISFQNGKIQSFTLPDTGYNSGEIVLDRAGLIGLTDLESENKTVDGKMTCSTKYIVRYFNQTGEEVAKNILKTEPFCAACPFVEVWNEKEAKWLEVGEILRQLNSEKKKAWNDLRLYVHSDELVVRLSEKKPETTYLDMIALQTDKSLIFPNSCEEKELSWCVVDGTDLILEEGTSHIFTFDVSNLSSNMVTLRGYGYYLSY